jgi:tetratricopeptide (TPR) repeat protein
MAIDKSNSKPWVKITVWILTFGLMFAFMGMGVTYLIANWDWLFSNDTLYSQMETQQQAEQTFDEQIALVKADLDTLEAQYAENNSDDTAALIASYSAYLAQLIYERGNTSEFTQAIGYLEKAIEIDAQTYEESAAELMSYLKQGVSP